MIREFMPTFLAQAQMPNMTDPRAELLAKMHDVIAPDPIGVWPPAVGWWIILLLGVSICITATYLLITVIQNRQYRKLALAEISLIDANPDLSEQEKILRTLHVLKRTFFTAYPNSRATSAGIYGAQWIKLLNTTVNTPIFDEQTEASLEGLLYAPESTEFDADKFIESSKRWIKKHRTNHKTLLTVRLNSEEAHV